DFDGNDAVVELIGRRQFGAHVGRIAGINADRIRRNPDGPEHGAHQVGFVLAVAVRLPEDLERRVRANAAAAPDPDLDRDILDVLRVTADGLDFFELRLRLRDQLTGFAGQRVIKLNLRVGEFADEA